MAGKAPTKFEMDLINDLCGGILDLINEKVIATHRVDPERLNAPSAAFVMSTALLQCLATACFQLPQVVNDPDDLIEKLKLMLDHYCRQMIEMSRKDSEADGGTQASAWDEN